MRDLLAVATSTSSASRKFGASVNPTATPTTLSMWKNIHQTQKYFLGALTPQEITDRIRNFRRRDIRSMSEDELADAILSIFSIDNNGQRQSFILRRQKQIPFGARLFRARSAIDGTFPLSCAVNEADAWAPPASAITSLGRLNKCGEPLLYTCLNDPHVTLVEIRAGLNQPIAIFSYRARRNIVTSELGEPVHHPQLTSEDLYKLNLFEDFLYEEFTREVGKGTEHLYRTSEIVAKWWFDLPEQDAWAYPSVQSRPKLNVVFRPEKAKECLYLEGALIGKIGFNGRFNIDAIAILNGAQFTYHAPGSEVQRQFFPWLNSKF